MFRGSDAGTLTSKAFARYPFLEGSEVRMAIISGVSNPEVPQGEAAVLFGSAASVKFVTVAAGIVDPLANAFAEPPYRANDARVRAENFIERAKVAGKTDCDELLFAPGRDTRDTLYLVEPCLADGTIRTKLNTPKPAAALAIFNPKDLPGVDPTATLREVTTGDINGDGHADILLEFGDRKIAALGDGQGKFKLRLLSVRLGSRKLDVALPLAIEPVRADGKRRQLVFPDGIMSLGSRVDEVTDDGTTLELNPELLWRNPSATWTQAIIRDFNGDGATEVAVIGASQDVEFFLGVAPGETPNPSRVSTSGLLKFITSGDYDGDGLIDLGMVVTEGSSSGADTVAVAYGKSHGPPEAPLALGQFDSVDLIASARPMPLKMDVLGCVYHPLGGGNQITIFTGFGERLLLSPFGVNGFAPKAASALEYVQSNPLSLALGHFRTFPTGTTKRLDAGTVNIDLSVTTPNTAAPRAWLSTFTDALRFTVANGSAPILAQVNLGILSGKSSSVFVETVALDIDNDGVDELITLSRAITGSDAKLGIIKSIERKGPEISTSEWAFDTSKITWMTFPDVVSKEPGATRESQLLVGDFDGDGRKDLLVHFGSKRQLYILWNEGGRLSEPILLGDSTAAALGRPTDPIQLVLEHEGAVVAGRFSGRIFRMEPLLDAVQNSKIAALAIFDSDGDGVADIAVSTGTRINVFMGIETRITK